MEKSANYVALEALKNDILEKQAFAQLARGATKLLGRGAEAVMPRLQRGLSWAGDKLAGRMGKFGDRMSGWANRAANKLGDPNLQRSVTDTISRAGGKVGDAMQNVDNFVGRHRGKLGLAGGLAGGAYLFGGSRRRPAPEEQYLGAGQGAAPREYLQSGITAGPKGLYM